MVEENCNLFEQILQQFPQISVHFENSEAFKEALVQHIKDNPTFYHRVGLDY